MHIFYNKYIAYVISVYRCLDIFNTEILKNRAYQHHLFNNMCPKSNKHQLQNMTFHEFLYIVLKLEWSQNSYNTQTETFHKIYIYIFFTFLNLMKGYYKINVTIKIIVKCIQEIFKTCSKFIKNWKLKICMTPILFQCIFRQEKKKKFFKIIFL